MNKARRSELEKISSALTDLMEQLQWVIDEEQEAFDNLPRRHSVQRARRADGGVYQSDGGRREQYRRRHWLH